MPTEYCRKTIRLKNFDYSFKGRYFITICCQNRQPLFGHIKNRQMILNYAGQMINKWWQKIPKKFPSVTIDEFAIMPDHFHGIICHVDQVRFDHMGSNLQGNQNICRDIPMWMSGSMSPSIPKIISWFKTMTTNEYIHNVKTNGWQYFDGKLWQRSYHDRFIRNQREFESIKNYIQENPQHH